LEVGTGFHPELTGRENLFLNGAILGMSRKEIRSKLDEIVDFSGVEKYIDTPVKRYSSGMYVRLAFAVAAHLEPEILIVDEVLAVGDAEFQRKSLGKMEKVAKEGRTVLFVSHNMISIQSLCQRAIWLDGGRLKEDGPVHQTVTNYLRSAITKDDTSDLAWEISDAPGNEFVRLHRIIVRPEKSDPDQLITMQTPLCIELSYWNLIPDLPLYPTLYFSNEHGIHVFTTGTLFSSDPNLHNHPQRGLFQSICHIPGSLLNSGVYRVDLLFVGLSSSGSYDQEKSYHLEKAISFEVFDRSERNIAWYGKNPGVISPDLTWDTNFLGDGGLIE